MNTIDSPGAKRKRSPCDDAPLPTPNLLPSPSNVTQINYLAKKRHDKMKLIEGDSETFSDVVSLIDDYEEVLQSHESLAANLGAKLVGPLLVKSFEKLFEGPIKILHSPNGGAEAASITWLDIVDLARTAPNSFALSDSAGGARVCKFWIRLCHVQISEDDYRLVLSGAPERMIPTQPIPEDEIAELGTIDILEQRLTGLIRKADLVAGRARQLNYHLKGRKTAIQGRRAALQQPDSVAYTVQGMDARQSASPFQAINNRSSSSSENQRVHDDLLRQFLSEDRKGVPFKAKPTRASLDLSGPLSAPGYPEPHRAAAFDELSGGQYRPLMSARNEKLVRGDPIWPPCDRCRRLRMDCTKYLTACTGCTKKHAKCTWNEITEDEISCIDETASSPGPGGAESGGSSDGALVAEASDSNPNLDPGLGASNGTRGVAGGGGGANMAGSANGSGRSGSGNDGVGDGSAERRRNGAFAVERGGDGRAGGAKKERMEDQTLLSRMASTAAAAAVTTK